MLSTQDNELLCRVGPNTPMGEMMRQYWIPFARSGELKAPDSPPLRIKLLGEELIAFRVTSGRVGLVGNHCPHRGASLFYGRNEEEGLRCVYHGWKFDVTGACVDMPSEPVECAFKDKVRAKAYPCRERGGVIWTYMGSRQSPPPLPDIEGNDETSSVAMVSRDCNYLQALEGDLDNSHFAFLHTGHMNEDELGDNAVRYHVRERAAARYAAIDTNIGICYGACRPASDDGKTNHWAIGNFLMPFYTQLPGGPLGAKRSTRAWVPMDDGHTLTFTMSAALIESRVAPDSLRIVPPPSGRGFGRDEILPDTTDWFGRARLQAQASNDYLLEREAVARGDGYAGFRGLMSEDQAMSESMGPISDRAIEHLAASDIMISRSRVRLLQAVRAFRDKAELPPGVDDPTAYIHRAGSILLPASADWVEATRELRTTLPEETTVAR